VADLRFHGLPEYSSLGGTIAGTVLVDSKKPVEAAQLQLRFRGVEHTRMTVQAGKQRTVIEEVRPFHEESLLFDPVAFGAGDSVHRASFSVTVPPDGPPSLATAPMPPVRGRFTQHPDGAYVEYTLEATLDIPWWPDPVAVVAVPVYSPRRVLGTAPPLRAPSLSGRPAITLDVDQSQLLPGSVVEGSFQVFNEKRSRLRSITVWLARQVEYVVRGRNRRSVGPRFEAVVPIDSSDPARAGRFSITLENRSDTTGPWQGALYRTYWKLGAHLDIGFGFDIDVEEPLVPT